jgi:hypothetical protein
MDAGDSALQAPNCDELANLRLGCSHKSGPSKLLLGHDAHEDGSWAEDVHGSLGFFD